MFNINLKFGLKKNLIALMPSSSSINLPIESKYQLPNAAWLGYWVKEAVLRITVMSFLKRAVLINCA